MQNGIKFDMQQQQLQQNQQKQLQQAQDQQDVQRKQPHQQQQQQQQQQTSQQQPGAQQDKEKEKEEKIINVPKGKHKFESDGTVFVVDDKYEHIERIKYSKYGAVCSAINKETGQKVAINKITNAYWVLDEAKRIVQEIKLLKSFDHDNVIKLLDVIRPNAPTGDDDIYLIFELMDTDLHRVISSRKQELSNEQIQYFIYLILRGLLYIHSANVIHRDLNPSNILLNSNCDLKICDFRMARGFEKERKNEFESCIDIARWHSAPEVILNTSSEYNKAVDIWSVGCIAAELLGRMPLFTGDNYLGQLQILFSVLGTPTPEDMASIIRNERFIKEIQTWPKRTKQPWQTRYPNANPQLLDLLNKMLTFNPDKRYTAKECLQHPYFEGLHFPEEEPEADQTFNWACDKFEPTKEILQKMIYRESLNFHNSG